MPKMPSDFLHKRAQTPLREQYIAAGVACSVSTNSKLVLESARGSFLPLERPPSIDFEMRFFVDGSIAERPPWPKPYVRGLGHLVFAGFGVRSSLLADLYARRVIGRFSTTMAGDRGYWRATIFPVLLSIIAGSVGIVELHASCVARDDQGLILMGPSRSGKSTVAMALMQAGFRLLSDDRTFCVLQQGSLRAYGLPRPLKLRPEAAHWFDEFRDREPIDIQNGEPVFYCEPSPQSVSTAVCEPRVLILLDRQHSPEFRMSRLDPGQIKARIEMDLLAEDSAALQRQERTLGGLSDLSCWHLRYGGPPQTIATRLVHHLVSLSEMSNPSSKTLRSLPSRLSSNS